MRRLGCGLFPHLFLTCAKSISRVRPVVGDNAPLHWVVNRHKPTNEQEASRTAEVRVRNGNISHEGL